MAHGNCSTVPSTSSRSKLHKNQPKSHSSLPDTKEGCQPRVSHGVVFCFLDKFKFSLFSAFLTTLRTILGVVRDTLSIPPRLTLTESSSGKFSWFLSFSGHFFLVISIFLNFDGKLTCFSAQFVRRNPENWTAARAG